MKTAITYKLLLSEFTRIITVDFSDESKRNLYAIIASISDIKMRLLMRTHYITPIDKEQRYMNFDFNTFNFITQTGYISMPYKSITMNEINKYVDILDKNKQIKCGLIVTEKTVIASDVIDYLKTRNCDDVSVIRITYDTIKQHYIKAIRNQLINYLKPRYGDESINAILKKFDEHIDDAVSVNMRKFISGDTVGVSIDNIIKDIIITYEQTTKKVEHTDFFKNSEWKTAADKIAVLANDKELLKRKIKELTNENKALTIEKKRWGMNYAAEEEAFKKYKVEMQEKLTIARQREMTLLNTINTLRNAANMQFNSSPLLRNQNVPIPNSNNIQMYQMPNATAPRPPNFYAPSPRTLDSVVSNYRVPNSYVMNSSTPNSYTPSPQLGGQIHNFQTTSYQMNVVVANQQNRPGLVIPQPVNQQTSNLVAEQPVKQPVIDLTAENEKPVNEMLTTERSYNV